MPLVRQLSSVSGSDLVAPLSRRSPVAASFDPQAEPQLAVTPKLVAAKLISFILSHSACLQCLMSQLLIHLLALLGFYCLSSSFNHTGSRLLALAPHLLSLLPLNTLFIRSCGFQRVKIAAREEVHSLALIWEAIGGQ